MSTVYKIHPAIGIGRLGSSQDYYIAPSGAGQLPTEYSNPNRGGNTFRDAQNNLLRQAAKFQVYAYDNTNPADPGTLVTVGAGSIKGINWTVWVASKKSSWFQFMQQTGSSMGPYPASAPSTDYAHSNDLGYLTNNINSPYNPNTNYNDPNLPVPANPIRYNQFLGTTADPGTMAAAARQPLILDPGPQTLTGPNQQAAFDLDSTAYPFLAKLQPFPITTLGGMETDAASNLIVLPGFGNSGTTDLPLNIGYYANNSGWFDDIADGPVTAELVLQDGSTLPVVNAWFSVGPPKYAPEAINMVTMYDTMYDVFVREMNYNPALFSAGAGGFQASYMPSFQDEVLPILQRPNVYQWFVEMPTLGRSNHGNLALENAQSSSAFLATFLPYLRGRGTQGMQNGQNGPAENQPGLMPKIAGDNPITNLTISKFLGLTQTQYFILTQFASPSYADPGPRPPTGPGAALDQALLENCVGGPFVPGIEITWITRNPSIYQPLPANPAASDRFRILAQPLSGLTPGALSLTNGNDNNYTTHGGLQPGDLTKYMAQPWQADFNECSNEAINQLPTSNNSPAVGPQVTLWWWPIQRPWTIYPYSAQPPYLQVPWTRGINQTPPNDNGMNTPGDVDMVTYWRDLGFIQMQPGAAATGAPVFQEVERNSANFPIQPPYNPPLG